MPRGGRSLDGDAGGGLGLADAEGGRGRQPRLHGGPSIDRIS